MAYMVICLIRNSTLKTGKNTFFIELGLVFFFDGLLFFDSYIYIYIYDFTYISAG